MSILLFRVDLKRNEPLEISGLSKMDRHMIQCMLLQSTVVSGMFMEQGLVSAQFNTHVYEMPVRY